jgi:hypothetical protein
MEQPYEDGCGKVNLDPNEGIVEYIYRGGFGDEAVVTVELRTVIPGIRQVIKTNQGVVTAVRTEKYPTPGLGHNMFLKNMFIKKFDDYFTWTGIYKYSHIPRGFGSISIQGDKPCEACLYEWFPGEEGFPWKITDKDYKLQSIHLHDWETFVKNFKEAGIIIGEDCYDLKNRIYSKNIIHQFPVYNNDALDMNIIWKRIDFGDKSMSIDYDQCEWYLQEYSHQLKEQLRPERYDMLLFSVRYLSDKNKLSDYDLKLLMNYIQDYRVKSVFHYMSHGTSLGGHLLYLDETPSRMQHL